MPSEESQSVRKNLGWRGDCGAASRERGIGVTEASEDRTTCRAEKGRTNRE